LNKLSLVVYASAVLLLATTVAGVYFQKPQTMEATYRWLPAGFLNRTTTPTQWGDMTGFKLVVSDGFNHTSSAPMITYSESPMTEQRLRTIAADVFGMDAPRRDEHPLSDIFLIQGHQNIRDDAGGIWYSTSPYGGFAKLEDWNQTDVRRIAEDVIADLEPYWEYPTDAVRKLTSLGPSGWHEETSLTGVVIESGITEFSVRYLWSVRGIEVSRNGCDVRVLPDGNVLSAKYHMPAVKIVGEQPVTVAPEDALAAFISGRSINSVIGAPRVRIYPIPVDGTVVVNDARLVYYPLESPEGEVIEALVYRIEFDILYEFEGIASKVTAVEYEYAN
jgi:hypothetical protein